MSLAITLISSGTGVSAALPSRTLMELAKLALDKNRDILSASIDQTSAANSLTIARATYDPSLSLSVSRTKTIQSKSYFASTGSSTALTPEETKATTDSGSLTVTNKTPWGPSLSLTETLGHSLSEATAVASSHSYSASLAFSISVPLLKGGWLVNNKLGVYQAENTFRSSQISGRQTQVDQVAAIAQTFVDLSAAYQDLEAKERALERAQKTLEETQVKIKAGKLAGVELLSTQISVNERRTDVINTQAQIQRFHDDIRTQLAISDFPEFIPMPIPIEKIKRNLDFETNWDWISTKGAALQTSAISRDNAERSAAAKKLNWWPQVDLAPSYTLSGASNVAQGKAFSNTFNDKKQKAWGLTLTLSMPLGNRTPYYELQNALNEKKKAEISFSKEIDKQKDLLRETLRQIRDYEKQLDWSQENLELSKKQMEAQQDTFRAGRLTTFKLVEYQDKYLSAETSRNSVFRSYFKAIVKLDQLRGEAKYLD